MQEAQNSRLQKAKPNDKSEEGTAMYGEAPKRGCG
jgi:hypothetical protein